MNKVKIAICGMGSRGMANGKRLLNLGSAEITAIAEPREDRRSLARQALGVQNSACFSSLEELAKAPKMADAMLITTQDRFHHSHAITALNAGYDILLEKPIAVSLEECQDIADTAKQLNRKAAIFHVLRYAPFYQAARKAIDDGIIGEPVNITALENVGYWHQAHSYVRGNWGNTEKSSFMLLTKCCHDLDLLVWLMGKPAERVSSFGSLKLFKEENAPKGNTARCMDGCAVKEACPFDCERFYIRRLKENKNWPVNVLTDDLTEEGVRQALRVGQYGRCVYHCDNNVVDHQVVNIQFAGGGTASLTMSGLTQRAGRELRVMGTKGEIYGDLEENRLVVAVFDKNPQVLDLNVENSEFSGHGGGDERLLDDFTKYVAGKPYDTVSMTGIEVSLQSHQVAFAAEKSRLTGQTVLI